jgi:hypothetical protein
VNYAVNLESLHENFPADFEVPPLLREFGQWLKNRRAGSVGLFRLQSERFDDFWIEHGADLHPNFAFFMRDCCGGQIGYWLYDGRTTVSPPIVMVGSEGELKILGDTLEDFLGRLANGHTQADELDTRDEDCTGGAELAEWLDSHSSRIPVQTRPDHPNLEQWMEKWGRLQREWIDQDPLHLQIADRLRGFVKPNARSWETADFDVLLVGTQFNMWHRSHGANLLPHDQISDLEPLFRSIRERRAEKTPERGLWFSSWVKVGSQGGAVLCCNFMDEPKILDERPIIPAGDYQRDLSKFPRSKHWFPVWLESLTQSAIR